MGRARRAAVVRHCAAERKVSVFEQKIEGRELDGMGRLDGMRDIFVRLGVSQ